MQSANKKKAVRYCKAPLSKKIREGGYTVVSEALVKKSVSNLIPKIDRKSREVASHSPKQPNPELLGLLILSVSY